MGPMGSRTVSALGIGFRLGPYSFHNDRINRVVSENTGRII